VSYKRIKVFLISGKTVGASRESNHESSSARADSWHSSGRVIAGARTASPAANWKVVHFTVAGTRAALPAEVDSKGMRSNVILIVAWSTMIGMSCVASSFGALLVSSSTNCHWQALLDTSLSNSLTRNHAIIDGKVVADVVSTLRSLLHGHILSRIRSIRGVLPVVDSHSTHPALSTTVGLKDWLRPTPSLAKTLRKKESVKAS
jgi:hypothetical protein